MLIDKIPPETAKILRDHNCFNSEGLLDSMCASQALGIEYNGKSTTRPNYSCIAETSYYAPSTPQHFFIINPDGSQLDPLGKSIKYPIKSYRLFKGKETIMGFDDKQILANARSLAQVLTRLGVPMDVENVSQVALSEMKNGSTTAFAYMFNRVMDDPKFKEIWTLKADCKCPPCPQYECILKVK
jgi:hypothetical protein